MSIEQRDKILNTLEFARMKGAAVEIVPQLLPEVDPVEAERWLAEAARLDGVENRWDKAADVYYSLRQKEKKPYKKVEYGIGEAQMMINAGDFNSAFLTLSELEESTQRIRGRDQKNRALSDIYRKRAWIADYQDKPDEEIRLLKKSKRMIKDVSARSPRDKDRLSEIDHFEGRARVKRARKFPDYQEADKDLHKAHRLFVKDRKRHESLGNPAGVGFNEAWDARRAMTEGNFDEARRLIKEASVHFKEFAEKTGASSILHHYHRVKAELAILEGNKEEAMANSIEALRLIVPKGSYYHGVIESTKLLIQASQIQD